MDLFPFQNLRVLYLITPLKGMLGLDVLSEQRDELPPAFQGVYFKDYLVFLCVCLCVAMCT